MYRSTRPYKKHGESGDGDENLPGNMQLSPAHGRNSVLVKVGTPTKALRSPFANQKLSSVSKRGLGVASARKPLFEMSPRTSRKLETSDNDIMTGQEHSKENGSEDNADFAASMACVDKDEYVYQYLNNDRMFTCGPSGEVQGSRPLEEKGYSATMSTQSGMFERDTHSVLTRVGSPQFNQRLAVEQPALDDEAEAEAASPVRSNCSQEENLYGIGEKRMEAKQLGLHRIVNLPDIRPPDIRWFFLPDTGYPAGYPAKISGHRISGNGRISG